MDLTDRNMLQCLDLVCFDDIKKDLMDSVCECQLSNQVEDFALEYKKVFNSRKDVRNNYLWRWLSVIYRKLGLTLSTVGGSYFDSVTDAKILLTMIFAILDDTAEVWKDEHLLNRFIDIIKNSDDEIKGNDEKLEYFKNIWNHFISIIKSYPRYEEFDDIFWYDFQQMLNSLRYNMLINKNLNMINLQEMNNYNCHNMIVFLLNNIDIMASPTFDSEDLSLVRKVFWHAQQMARIGNWLSTWKRELKEKDFSSGVFAYAFEHKIITIKEIENLSPEEIIDKIENSGMKEYFLNIWEINYKQISTLKGSIKSIDMDAYLKGLKILLKYHLASEGMK